MLIRDPTPQALGDRIAAWLDGRVSAEPATVRALVEGRHDHNGYADRIVAELQSLADEARMRRKPSA